MRRRLCSPAICLVIVLVWLSEPTLAANSIWDANGANPPDGTYNVANNWNPNTVPGDADTAIFRFGSAPPYTITFPGAPIIQPPVLHVNDQLRVGSNQVTFRSNLRAAYTLDNPATSEAGRGIIIGELAGDIAVLNNSLLTLTSAAATIGDAAGSEGTLHLNAGTFHVTGSSGDNELIVGNSGKGTLNVGAGARLNVSGFNGNVILGNRSGSTGTVTVRGPGASATISLIDVGGGLGNGTGTFDVTNGGQVTVTDATFGTIVRGLGTVNVDGAGSIWRNSGSFLMGGALNITNGGSVSIDPEGNATLTIGGIVNVSGTGSLLTDGAVSVIDGALNITAGGNVNSTGAVVGNIDGTATVDGAGSIWTNSSGFDVGFSPLPATGTVVVRNDGELHSLRARIGLSSATGMLHVNSRGKVVVSDVIELAGTELSTGTILVEGEGSILTTPELDVGGGGGGLFPGGSARLTINGGSVNVNNVRIYSAGQVNINGGILDVTGTLTRLAGSVVHLDGGTLRLRNAAGLLAFPDTFDWTGGTLNLTETGLTVGPGGLFGSHLVMNSRMGLQVAGALDVNSGAQLVGTGGAVSAGGGTNNGTISIIGGSLNYSQPAVNNGNLDALRATLTFPGDGVKNNIGLTNNATLTLANVTVNGDVHSPAGSTINVAAGVVFNGLVSGGGNFPGAGTVTFNGGFSPGDSPAAVTFGGGIDLGPSGVLEMELGGTAAGREYDQLDVEGLLSLGGKLEVALLDGFMPRFGDAFDLLNYGTLAGRFDTIDLPALDPGLVWDTSTLYSTGAITAVPEPAGWLFALVGLFFALATLPRASRWPGLIGNTTQPGACGLTHCYSLSHSVE